MRKVEVIMYGCTWVILTTFIALANFTGWPISDRPIAVSTDRAIFGTVVLSGLLFFILGLVTWNDWRYRRRIERCQHEHTRTTTRCLDCGTLI